MIDLQITKHASDNCGVGATLIAWKQQDNACCSHCQQGYETTAHILWCQGHNAQTFWDKGMGEVTVHMHKSDMDPLIQQALLQGM